MHKDFYFSYLSLSCLPMVYLSGLLSPKSLFFVAGMIHMILFRACSSIPKSKYLSFRSKNLSLSSSSVSSYSSPLSEYIFSSINEEDDNLLKLFPRSNIVLLSNLNNNNNENEKIRIWTAFREGIQLDCIPLPDYFISGKQPLSSSEVHEKWKNLMRNRLSNLNPSSSSLVDDNNDSTTTASETKLSSELKQAQNIVRLASFVSRTLQCTILKRSVSITSTNNRSGDNTVGVSLDKEDSSPVTVADFTVQALIIDRLSRAFPSDHFIAEEDSSMLRQPAYLDTSRRIIHALQAATGEEWNLQRLYDTLDKGKHSVSHIGRVWVLDPIDGTKGFIRGEHYCIALALLVDGKPQLSVLGCPNLDLNRVISARASTVSTVGKIQEPSYVPIPSDLVTTIENRMKPTDTELLVFPPSSGSIYYAVSGEGAYAKSLSMSDGAGYEVQVSDCDSKDIILCESTEASHGNRDVTAGVYNILKLRHDFLRLDGQCKYCVLGSGAAQGNLRLPQKGYQEKIWDSAPGSHFVSEAGGKVTDLNGNVLNFSEGRYLSESVEGIVSSNSQLHSQLLSAVNKARKEVEEQDIKNNVKRNAFGHD